MKGRESMGFASKLWNSGNFDWWSLDFRNLNISRCFGWTSGYLLCPVNWLTHQLIHHDIPHVEEILVSCPISARKSQLKSQFSLYLTFFNNDCFRFCSLQRFLFLSHSFSFCLSLQTTRYLDSDKVYRAENRPTSSKVVVKAMLSVPHDLAPALGFNTIVCIFDHLEVCDFALQPFPRFGRSDEVTGLPDLRKRISPKSVHGRKVFRDGIVNRQSIFEANHCGGPSLIDRFWNMSWIPWILRPTWSNLFRNREWVGNKKNNTEYTKFKPVIDSLWRELLRQEIVQFALFDLQKSHSINSRVKWLSLALNYWISFDLDV
jgi:hypothetical protein